MLIPLRVGLLRSAKLLALAGLMTTVPPAIGQQAPNPCAGVSGMVCQVDNKCIQVTNSATVPLNDTGIGDWRYLNPRRPFPLVRAVSWQDRNLKLPEACFREHLDNAVLIFENQTSSRPFEVVFPYELPGVEAQRQKLEKLWLNIAQPLDVLAALRRELRTLSDRLADMKPVEGESPGSAAYGQVLQNRLMVEKSESEAEKLRESLSLNNEILEQGRNVLLEARRLGIPLPEYLTEMSPPVLERIDELVNSLPEPLDASRLSLEELLDFLNSKHPLPENGNEVGTANYLCNEAFDKFNYSTQALLNLKACFVPLQLAIQPDSPWPSLASSKEFVGLAEEVRKLISLMQDVIAEGKLSVDGKPSVDAAFGEACKPNANGFGCGRVVTVSPGQPLPVNGLLWQLLGSVSQAIEFVVRFANDAEIPANSTGFLALKADVKEPPDVSRWIFSGSVGASADPSLVNFVEDLNDGKRDKAKKVPRSFVSPDYPYEGDQNERFTGAGSLKLTQKLGNRATGSATLSFKGGDLGEKDQSNQTKVSEYQLHLFGDNGLQLRFGKYGFLTTRDNFALSESGEGFELIWRNFGGGVLFKREGKPGDNESSRLYFAQAQNLFLGRNEFFRRVSLQAAYGEEEGEAVSRVLNCDPSSDDTTGGIGKGTKVFDHLSLGGEVFFGSSAAKATWSASGSFSYYYSERDADERFDSLGLIRDGDGSVSLLTMNWNSPLTKERTVNNTFSMQIGYGTGDNPNTADEDEGYLFDSAKFAPDKIFLSQLAGRIHDVSRKGADCTFCERGRLLVAPGLSNKTYLGLTYINSTTSGPLAGVVQLLKITDKIVSQSMTFRSHFYRFNEPVLETREAGMEVSAEFSVQVPRGVTTTVSLARFFPGTELGDLIKEEPWSATALVKVSL